MNLEMVKCHRLREDVYENVVFCSRERVKKQDIKKINAILYKEFLVDYFS